MNKLLLLISSFLLCGTAISQVFDVETIWQSGPTDNRVNIILLGDGYTAAEQGDFVADAQAIFDGMFQAVPYAE